MIISERTIKDDYKQAAALAIQINGQRAMLRTMQEWNDTIASNWQPNSDLLVFQREGGAYQFGLASGDKYALTMNGIYDFDRDHGSDNNYPTHLLASLIDQLHMIEQQTSKNLMVDAVPEIGLDAYLPENN